VISDLNTRCIHPYRFEHFNNKKFHSYCRYIWSPLGVRKSALIEKSPIQVIMSLNDSFPTVLLIISTPHVYKGWQKTLFTFTDEKNTGASSQIHPTPPTHSPWPLIMSCEKSRVPLKTSLNQTQLIPLASLIIPFEERVIPISLLTSAFAVLRERNNRLCN